MNFSTKFRHILQEFKPCLKQQFRNKFTFKKKTGRSQVPRPVPPVFRQNQVVIFQKSLNKLEGMSFTRLFTYLRFSLLNNSLYRIGLWRSIIGSQTGQATGQTAADKLGICEKVKNIFRVHLLTDRFLLIPQLKSVGKKPDSRPGKRGGTRKKGAAQKGRHRKGSKKILDTKKKKPKRRGPKKK